MSIVKAIELTITENMPHVSTATAKAIAEIVANPETINTYRLCEQASVKLFTFPCGCETMKYMEKHDCTAGHSCKACRGKVVRKHCGTHKGLPVGDPTFSWL